MFLLHDAGYSQICKMIQIKRVQYHSPIPNENDLIKMANWTSEKIDKMFYNVS